MLSLPNDISRCSTLICDLKEICVRNIVFIKEKEENKTVLMTEFDGSNCENLIEANMQPGTIWVSNQKHNIRPEDSIRTTRRLTSFSVFFCVRNALLKSQGGWYWLGLDGRLEFIGKTLDNINFDMLYQLNKKELKQKYYDKNKSTTIY